MTIENLADLKALIQLCRKTGVESITVDGVTLTLGQEPQAQKRVKAPKYRGVVPGPMSAMVTADTEIQMPDELTEEQLLNWSVGAGEN